jgi:hypothetical protein
MKCKTTNFHESLNTESNGNLHDKKCDKRKNEIIIFVAKYLKIELGESLLKLDVQKNKRCRNTL